MFTLIPFLILFLPGAFLPVALQTLFTSNELNEMGVYLEDSQPMPAAQKKPVNPSQDRTSRLVTSLSV